MSETKSPQPVVHYAIAYPTSARGTFRPACKCGWKAVVNGTKAAAIRYAEKHHVHA